MKHTIKPKGKPTNAQNAKPSTSPKQAPIPVPKPLGQLDTLLSERRHMSPVYSAGNEDGAQRSLKELAALSQQNLAQV